MERLYDRLKKMLGNKGFAIRTVLMLVLLVTSLLVVLYLFFTFYPNLLKEIVDVVLGPLAGG